MDKQDLKIYTNEQIHEMRHQLDQMSCFNLMNYFKESKQIAQHLDDMLHKYINTFDVYKHLI